MNIKMTKMTVKKKHHDESDDEDIDKENNKENDKEGEEGKLILITALR